MKPRERYWLLMIGPGHPIACGELVGLGNAGPRPLAEILQTARLSTNMDARTAEKDLAVASMTDSQATTTCLGE